MRHKTVRLSADVITKLLSGPRLIGGGHALAPQVSPQAELVGAVVDYGVCGREIVLHFVDPEHSASEDDARSPNSCC